MGAEEALKLARSVEVVVSTKNGRVLHLESKTTSEDALLAALLGPTGNLRAPTIKAGDKLLVGYDEKAYKQILC